jgi:DNA ligase-1
MKAFANLYSQLDQTTKTNRKLQALLTYFQLAEDKDKLWAIALFTHRRPRRTVNTTMLRQWAAEHAEIPDWLFEESYHIVGDLAETIALVLPVPDKITSVPPLHYWIDYLNNLRDKGDNEKKEAICAAWSKMNREQRFVFNKIITGGFRVGVSERLMIKALAQYLDLDEPQVALRLSGNWSPVTTTFHDLLQHKDPSEDLSRPYPFYLTYALDIEPETLGNPSDWQAERKWDGIRGQLIKRNGEIFVWTRGGELVTEKYPEYAVLREKMQDGTALDGEILPFRENKPLTFQDLQTRIGRKTVSRKLLETTPVIFKVYDIMEHQGNDVRTTPIQERRKMLEEIVQGIDHSVLQLSETLEFDSWDELMKIKDNSRQYFCEGVMLKRKDSPYRDGRKRGDWWKWKVDPMVIDAVMIYAMRGHGRRANLYTDYTFAVWDEGNLVPFAKAYSGLTDQEINEVDRFVKQHTIDRFGPVRSVDPELVFEIAFEGINKSSRHKSGVAIRFPRIHRWRKDKKAEEANTLEDLYAFLP